MDKDNSNNGDKRNWRERLGINAGKEMPRIAEEFQSTTPPRATVRPAPMAPRPQGKPVLSRANPVAQPGAQERLADKLKAQRDAQERLAEQRVAAARKSVEVKPPAIATAPAAPIAAKPKFTFAEEAQAPKPAPRPAAAIVQPPIIKTPERVAVPPPVVSTPPRPGLGMERPAMPPRPTNLPPPPVTSQRPPVQQPRYTPTPPNPYPPAQNYAPPPPLPPAYRPIDPASRGYQPSSYQPQQPYAPAAAYPGQRMAPPPLAPARGYNPPELRTAPRVNTYRDEDVENDIFDEPRSPRRATANEYQKAYRDAEQGYDDDLPPSRGPWVPLLLLALAAVVAGGLVWFYQTNMAAKNTAAATTTTAPVVEAPAEPPKAVPEPAIAQPANTPSKKLIYDRIVGDREVLGGDVMQSEEVPALPQDNGAADPAAAPAAGEQGISDPQPAGGDDTVPLPLPPPPGEDGAGDQQGAAPSNKSSNEASITPAAGDSQAAASSQGTDKVDGSAGQSNEVTISKTEPQQTAEQAPAPGELTPAVDPAEKILEETSPPAVAPVVKKKPETKKPVKKAEKNLGSKPVVLVPPSKQAKAAAKKKAPITNTEEDTDANIGSIYDGDAIVDQSQAAPATPTAPTKKKRTLADLFSNDDANTAAPAEQQVAAVEEPIIAQPETPKKKVAVLPDAAPKKQASAGGGYVVQLASFRSRDEANAEYSRLRGKHAALGSLGPIVTEAVVGGSTRYRLAAGTLGSRADASAVCAKLFAGGERDCIVRQQ